MAAGRTGRTEGSGDAGTADASTAAPSGLGAEEAVVPEPRSAEDGARAEHLKSCIDDLVEKAKKDMQNAHGAGSGGSGSSG